MASSYSILCTTNGIAKIALKHITEMTSLLRMFLYKLPMLNQMTEVQRTKLYLYLAQ